MSNNNNSVNPFERSSAAATVPPMTTTTSGGNGSGGGGLLLTHERIIGFFEDHPYIDPTHFMLSCIGKFQDHVHEDATTHVLKHDVALGMRDDYQAFMARRATMLALLKSTYRELLHQTEHLSMMHMHEFLAKKFDLSPPAPPPPPSEQEQQQHKDDVKNTADAGAGLATEAQQQFFECSFCGTYKFASKRALAGHVRKCKKVKTDGAGGGGGGESSSS